MLIECFQFIFELKLRQKQMKGRHISKQFLSGMLYDRKDDFKVVFYFLLNYLSHIAGNVLISSYTEPAIFTSTLHFYLSSNLIYLVDIKNEGNYATESSNSIIQVGIVFRFSCTHVFA